jgi:hypothetical protein
MGPAFFGGNDFLVFCSTAYKAMGPWDRQVFGGMIIFVLHKYDVQNYGTTGPVFFQGEIFILLFFSTTYKAMGPWDRHFLRINHLFSFNVLLQSYGTMGPAFFGVNDFFAVL